MIHFIYMETDTIKQHVDALSGSFFLTDETATIIYANQAIESQSGYAGHEAVGRKPQELWGGQMEAGFYRSMWQTLLNTGRFVGDVVNKRKDGSLAKERIHLAAAEDASSTKRYFFAVNPASANDAFSREFISLADSRRGQTDSVIEWMFDRLAPSISFQSDGVSLHDFLTTHIAAPTKAQYAYREVDRQLVADAKKDPRLFAALYEKYYDEIYAYFFYRIGNSRSVAHDLSQDTFLRAFRSLKYFELKNASYFTYIQRIAHNILVNYYRKRRPDSLETLPYPLSDGPKDIDPILAKERVWSAAAFLSDIERDILVMKYQDEYSIREIAGMLQKSENAIKLHLSRARKKLRVRLQS